MRRIDRAAATGCDAVEPDNVDGYLHNTGFTFNRTDQIAYLKFLAEYAHVKGLSIGLKIAVELIAPANLAAVFD